MADVIVLFRKHDNRTLPLTWKPDFRHKRSTPLPMFASVWGAFLFMEQYSHLNRRHCALCGIMGVFNGEHYPSGAGEVHPSLKHGGKLLCFKCYLKSFAKP